MDTFSQAFFTNSALLVKNYVVNIDTIFPVYNEEQLLSVEAELLRNKNLGKLW